MMRDPWKDIRKPDSSSAVQAHRVSVDAPWDFFWAKDLDNRCLLVLRHGQQPTPANLIPSLLNIEVTDVASDGGKTTLCLRLLDDEQRDLFHRLCLDVIEAASKSTTEEKAVQISLARTWRWHHLLRGDGSGLLSLNRQKGLIGELKVLAWLTSVLPAADAIASWVGPLGAPKDFEIGKVAIECKARRTGSVPHVAISSEHQLDLTGCETLYMHVVDLTRAPADESDSFSLSEAVLSVRARLGQPETTVHIDFERLLAAAGFRREDDYSEQRWIQGMNRFYHVRPSFPRIEAADLRPGVTGVQYSVELPDCSDYEADVEEVQRSIRGLSDVS